MQRQSHPTIHGKTQPGTPTPTGKRHLRATLLLALLTMLCSLSSCFTMAVWGFEPEQSTDQNTGKRETVMVYDSETEWSWELFGMRLLATPLTLILDIATSPIQAFFLQNDDDDEDDHEQ
jgi:hypothetical protein